MKRYDIATKSAYKDKKSGEEKVSWLRCGILAVTDDGKMFLKLNMWPDVNYYVFEQKKFEKPAAKSEWEE